jgi:hypothetical protein
MQDDLRDLAAFVAAARECRNQRGQARHLLVDRTGLEIFEPPPSMLNAGLPSSVKLIAA